MTAVTAGASGRDVRIHDVEGLGGDVDQLHGARHDTPVRVPADRFQRTGPGERLLRERVELVAGEDDARRRPEQVRQPVGRTRLERVGPRDLDLVEGLAPVRGARSTPSDETIRPSLSGYSVRVPEGDEARLALE